MTQKQKAVVVKHLLLSHSAIKDLSLISSIIGKAIALHKDFIQDTDDLLILSKTHKNLGKTLRILESHCKQTQSLLEENG